MSEKISKDPMQGWKWWQEAWIDTNGARVEFFVVGLLFAVVTLILGRFPLVRSITPHVLAPFLLLAAFEFSKSWKERKRKDFQVLLNPFKDPALFKRLLPVSIAGVLFGVGYLVCNWLADRSLGLGTLRFGVALIENSAFLFAVPNIAYKNEDAVLAMKKSLKTVFDNAAIFSVFFGVGILSLLAGICSFGIGFFFLFPLYLYLPYLIYNQVKTD